MKKPQIIATALLLTAVLLLSGCSKQTETSLPDTDSGNSSEISDNGISNNNSSDTSDNSENSDSTPEPPKPDGEPTFLTAPDGTPIYTSEISEVYTGSEIWDDKKAVTFEQAEQMAQSGEGSFTVRCDGFVYGCVPEKALNRIDDPEMFESKDNGKSFKFLGELSDKNSAFDRRQTDWLRFKVGDKFGDLTVKNAYTLYTNNGRIEGVPDVPGAHIDDGCIEFEGELELDGYISVVAMEAFYGIGGDLKFYPNGESSTKLPNISPFWERESNKYYATAHFNYYGYFGELTLDLGNMFEIDCDTSGLHPGDSFVKVRVTLDNIRFVPGIGRGMKADLKSVELI